MRWSGVRTSTLTATAALLVVFGLYRYGSAMALAMALAAPWTDALLAPLTGTPEVEEIRFATAARPLVADLYRPSRRQDPSRAILLVHGLSPAGRRQPDLVRLAHVLARHGELVMVPAFDGLAAFRLTGQEVIEIRGALQEIQRRAASVGVVGFSFGAGPALLAAADAAGLRYAASFGGYADLRSVITFISTGVHRFDAQRFRDPVEPYNRWKLAALLVPFVEPPADRQRLASIVDRRLRNPSEDTSGLEARLTRTGAAILALVRNEREDAVPGLLAKLPESLRGALDALSPLPAVRRLRAPVLLAHGLGDTSIPYTESLRLAAEAADARLRLLRGFHHTGPSGHRVHDVVLDAWRLVALAHDILSLRRTDPGAR